MTKLLTLKKMKKKLILLTLILALSTLVGCNKEHTHKFKQAYDDEVHYMECKCGEREGDEYLHQLEWVNAEDINTTKLQCSTCGWVYDFDKMFANSVTAEPMSFGDMPGMPPVISYRISADSGKYKVGEEFEITLLLCVNDNRILDGPFHVKLAKSPYYEIIDKDEYIISDFCKADYSGNPEIEFKFKIKATAPCDTPSRFEFKIKCNADYEEYEDLYDKYANAESYCDFSDEYFITVCDLGFVINSKNIFISEDTQDLFYSTTNHEYINGTITKDEYIARVTEYLYYGSAAVKRYDDNHYSYYSKNIRAFFTLGEDYEYLSSCFDNNNSDDPYFEGYLSAANDLLDILLENNLISNAEYEIEKTYLSENGVRNARNSRYLVENLIPFYNEYEARIEEMTIQCVDSAL